MKPRVIILTILFSIILPLISYSKGLGPFDIPPLGSNEIFREIPAFVSPTEHAEKKIRFNVSTRCLNTWTYNIETDNESPDEDPQPSYGSFLVDMESYSIFPRISFKANDNIRFEAILPVVHQTGGILDGAIEKFHDTFLLGQHHRSEWQRNETSLMYIEPDGKTLTHYDESDLRGVFIGNLTLGTSFQTKKLPLPANIRVLMTFPTTNMPVSFDGKSYNTTVQTSFSWKRRKLIGYHGIGITHFSNSRAHGMRLKKKRFSLLNSFEYQKSDSFSFILHIVSASPVADYPKLDEPVIGMTLGFKAFVGRGVFELGIIENLFFFDNSPDIGIHLGYSIGLF